MERLSIVKSVDVGQKSVRLCCLFAPLIFKDDGNRLDDLFLGIGFAINNHFMRKLNTARHVEIMFLGQPIVPARVPRHQHVSVFLVGISELSAGQGLNVNEAVLIGIG